MMKIVVDSNRVIASLIKEGTTRKILFDELFEFVAPEFLIQEVYKYKNRLEEASGMNEEELNLLLAIALKQITIVARAKYISYTKELNSVLEDKRDLPYLAVCLAVQSEGIWTHDTDFLKQKKVKVFTNKDMLKFVGGQLE